MLVDLPVFYGKKQDRAAFVDQIQMTLKNLNISLATAIAQRDLYFRVSVIANCNLSCKFCHNEGAPTEGRISYDFAQKAIQAAKDVGFTRVQFTGGEPLLRKDIGSFILMAKTIMDDVGVTTNGTFLPARVESLIEAGVTRIHISLQTETLIEYGDKNKWGIPDWLAPILEYAAQGIFSLRLNVPIPGDCLLEAEEFLPELLKKSADVKVFSILPEGETSEMVFPYQQLQELVERVNDKSNREGWGSFVLLRGFKYPEGIRCKTCKDFDRCKEQSHSLRLGSDYILRPCLATREWDIMANEVNLSEQIREAALLALDYVW